MSDAPSKTPTAKPSANPCAQRHNEWTRAKMVSFLRELAATQSVAAAAKAVGMSRTSAYNLRNRLQGQPFALGWEVALEMGMHSLAQALMDRALNGVEVQHYYHGELVATTRRFDNRLAQWLIANPWAVGRQQIAREYLALGFEPLLERIEAASLRWEQGEAMPGPNWPYADDEEAQTDEGAFYPRSWYAAQAGELLKTKRRGGR